MAAVFASRSIESANSCSRPLHDGTPCFAASRGSFKPNGLTSRLAKVGAPQRTSCVARVTGTHVRREDVGGDHDDRCARLTGTIGKELEKVKVCEPSCHRAGRSRARELALGETNTAYRAWECTNRITSRREQLRGLFRFPPSRLPFKHQSRVLTRDGDVRELRARATAGAERVRRIWLRRPGANYELQ